MINLNQTYSERFSHFQSPQDILAWLAGHQQVRETTQQPPFYKTAFDVLDTGCGNELQLNLFQRYILQLLGFACNTYCIATPEKDEADAVLTLFHDLGEVFCLAPKNGRIDTFENQESAVQTWLSGLSKPQTYVVYQIEPPTRLIPRNNPRLIYENARLHSQQIRQILTQDTRNSLLNASKNVGMYKDKSRGKNRFQRKKYSKMSGAVKQYNAIDMNQLFKKDILEVTIPIVGETNNYQVVIKLEGVIEQLAKNIKNNQNKFEYRSVVQALTRVFNTKDVFIKCSCDDFKYRFAHWAIIHNYSVDDSAKDPGPGKGIANPKDDKGRGCKHCLLVLNNLQWIMKVASVINNYIHYTQEKAQKPFLNIIFPKLYGIPADEMVQQGLVDSQEFLETSKGVIDAINEYGKNRGKFKPGSNKNTAGKGTAAQPTKKEEEKATGQTGDAADDIKTKQA